MIKNFRSKIYARDLPWGNSAEYIPSNVPRAGYCWVVLSPGKEPHVGYPTRTRYAVPVRTRHVVQDRTLPLELLFFPLTLPPSVSLFLPLPRTPCPTRGEFDSRYCSPCWILLGGSFSWKRTSRGLPHTEEIFRARSYKACSTRSYSPPRVVVLPPPPSLHPPPSSSRCPLAFPVRSARIRFPLLFAVLNIVGWFFLLEKNPTWATPHGGDIPCPFAQGM